MMPEVQQEYFNVVEVARYIGRTEGSVRCMIQRGDLPVSRLGARVLIAKADLEKLIRKP